MYQTYRTSNTTHRYHRSSSEWSRRSRCSGSSGRSHTSPPMVGTSPQGAGVGHTDTPRTSNRRLRSPLYYRNRWCLWLQLWSGIIAMADTNIRISEFKHKHSTDVRCKTEPYNFTYRYWTIKWKWKQIGDVFLNLLLFTISIWIFSYTQNVCNLISTWNRIKVGKTWNKTFPLSDT